MRDRVRKRDGSSSVVEITVVRPDCHVRNRIDGVPTTTRIFRGGSEEVFAAFDGGGEWVDHLAREYDGACGRTDGEIGRVGRGGGEQ